MRWSFFRPAAALACAAVLITGASAQTSQVQTPAQTQPAPQTQPPPDATTLVPPVRTFRLPARIGVFGEARITLQQALAMALANNKDIVASRIDREISGYSLTGARGLYDPTIGAVSQFLKQQNPVASSLGGSATGAVLNRTWQTDPTLSGSSPWLGGSYHVDLSSQRIYTNNTFVTLNPQYPSALNFQYTQPLWRNLRYDLNRHAIDVARKNRTLSDEQFRLRVMQVVQQTEQAYWEVFYAYNNLQVQLDSVDIARQQDESNRRQQQQGLLAPIDVVAAQTQLANFELNAYSAQTALTQSENNLKTLMLEGRTSALWASALVPVTAPDGAPPLTPLSDAVNEALANRPELSQVEISAQINAKDTRLYRDQTKPQVDLVGSYTRNGLAGLQITQSGVSPFTASFAPLVDRLNILSADAGLAPINLSSGTVNTAPALLIGDYGQSLSNLWAGNFPTTQVQLRVSLPIRNRAAEANLSTAVAQGRRIQNQREQVEQTIEADVRNAMQLMQSAELRLEAARVQRESAEEQYNSEQRQFRAGTSTLFLVQQRQTTMITARSQERRAESDLGEAVSAYELATGSILRQHNINLQ
jgi:outer membrane protein TolC